MKSRNIRLALIGAVLMTAIGCALGAAAAVGAFGHSAQRERVAQSEVVDESGKFTGNPLALSMPVADASSANAQLPFEVVLPSGIQSTGMWVTDPSKTPALERQVVADFDVPGIGVYQLNEQPTSWTVSTLQQWAQDCTTCTIQKVVTVRGIHVLVMATPGMGLGVFWVRGDGTAPVLTEVSGPYSTFSESGALAVADDIIGQSG